MIPIHHYIPKAGWYPQTRADVFLIFFEHQVLVNAEGVFLWPQVPGAIQLPVISVVVCGEVDGKQVGVLLLNELPKGAGHVVSVRSLMQSGSEACFHLLSHGLQIIQSRLNQRYCNRCGGKTHPKEGEWSQECSQCQHRSYPVISPCIIVAIRKKEEILLVRHRRYGVESTLHTVIAGFVEPGESAEQAVVREVKEETGIGVTNVRYQCSQSWPFPHSLMLGFHADYLEGDLLLDQKELCDGGWFSVTNLPDLPPEFTISRRLVDKLIKSLY